MSTYIHFTEEQKIRANEVDLVEFLQRQGEKLLPSGREKRIASDHSITVRGNEWYDHALEQGGLAIDFVQNFYGLSFPEAVTKLLSGEQGELYSKTKERKQIKRKPFVLPPKNSDMRRVFAYLIKNRHIDRDVVSFFAKQKLLYESCEQSANKTKEYHNAVFVGYDENGVPCHAHKRGIYSHGNGFKGNIESGNPCYSFHYTGISNRLYVFEAPIDMLSFITIYKNIHWQEHSYVALCGVSVTGKGVGNVDCCGAKELKGHFLDEEVDLSLMDETLKKYKEVKGSLITILQNAQEIYGFLPMSVLEYISQETGIYSSQIYGVATFYTQFRLNPVGENLIMLCKGTACHVNGADGIEEAITEELGIKDGETTEDKIFTLNNVACLGCCSLSPVMMVNGETYGSLTPQKTKEILREIGKQALDAKEGN